MTDEPLTPEEWREAFRRVCVIADWRDLVRPSSADADGVYWCSECEKFDPVGAARAVLDDDKVRSANDSESWIMRELLRATP